MKIYPHLIVCPLCSALYRYRSDGSGTTACCERCHTLLWQNRSPAPLLLLPLTLAALITFSLACLYPVMMISFHGARNEITLWQTAWALTQAGSFPLMAILTAFLLIMAPLMQILLLLWLLAFAHFRRRAPGFISMMKTLSWLRPWSMADVGVLGFLIAAIKLSSLLDVAPGAGGWALAGSVVLMIIVNSYDLRPLWIVCRAAASAERGYA